MLSDKDHEREDPIRRRNPIMSLRLFCSLSFIFLYMSFSARVLSQDIQTVFTPDRERVVLLVNHEDNRIKVIIEPDFGTYTDYYFEQFDLQWIIPLPAPAIEAEDAMFSLPSSYSGFREELNQLDDLTQVRFEPEILRYCYDTFEYMGRSGDHSYSVDLMAQMTDYAVVPNADPDTVLNQLHEEGYDITGDDVLQLQQYAEAGLSFLAVKYHLEAQEEPGAYEYTIYGSPLDFSFYWPDEAIPLTFSSPNYGTTWIFSDQAYHSVNIPQVLPDYSLFHAPHSIMNTGSHRYYDFVNNDYSILTDRQYQEETERILTGGGLLVEYTGSTDVLAALDAPILRSSIENYPYVSRFAIRTSDTMPYPLYESAQNQPDHSNVIDLREYVDPLTYWGCSSRTALDENTHANLPDARYRVDDIRFAVAYPPDWQFSTLVSDEGTIYGFSPEPLTPDTVSAAINGDSSQAPMFIFSEHTYITDGYAGPLLTENNLFTQLDIEMLQIFRQRNFRVRFDMRQKEYQQEHGVMYGLIASESDWAEHDAMYKAMLDYAQSYQYFVSEEWANTLFIQSQPRAETVITLEIPYPDGWIEHMDGEEIVISRETAELRLIPVEAATPDLLYQHHQLSEDLPCEQPSMFQANGREGYIFPTIAYLVVVSAPTGEIAEYESLLLEMMSNLPDICIR